MIDAGRHFRAFEIQFKTVVITIFLGQKVHPVGGRRIRAHGQRKPAKRTNVWAKHIFGWLCFDTLVLVLPIHIIVFIQRFSTTFPLTVFRTLAGRNADGCLAFDMNCYAEDCALPSCANRRSLCWHSILI